MYYCNMRCFFLFCLAVYYVLPVNSQPKNSLTEQHIRGNVKAITERVYVAKDTILRDDNKLFSKSVNFYNEEGFLIQTYNYNNIEKLISYNLFKYDSIKGLKIEDKIFFPDSTFKERYTYKYDEQSNLIEERVYDRNDTLKPAVINKYDIKVKDEPEFDSDEEKVEIVITTKQKNTDKFGNWQTQITFEKKTPVSITIREIEYYLKSDEIGK